MNTHKKLPFLVLLLLTSIAMEVHAQAHVQQQMRMHQQAVNMHLHQARQFQNMVLMNNHMRMSRNTTGKYQFTLITNDGDTIHPRKKVSVSLLYPMEELKIKTKAGKKTYKPEDTKEILVRYGKKTIKGMPRDSCWIFETYHTKDYTFYSYHPELATYNVSYYQKPGGEIEKLDSSKIEKIIRENPRSKKAEKAIRKKKYHKAIRIYLKEESTH